LVACVRCKALLVGARFFPRLFVVRASGSRIAGGGERFGSGVLILLTGGDVFARD